MNGAKRVVGFIMTLVLLAFAAGCATDTEVERTKLPGVDKPATETRTGY